jgi:hypothetical protein
VKLLIENFNGQAYKKKEIVIIYSGDKVYSQQNEKKAVKIYNVPGELSYGTCLRIGLIEANGDYVLVMDDNVLLGKRFFSDFILHLRCVDKDLFKIPVQKPSFDQTEDQYWKNTLRNCLFLSSDEKCFDDKATLFAIKKRSQLYNIMCSDREDPYVLIDRCKSEFAITDMLCAVMER